MILMRDDDYDHIQTTNECMWVNMVLVVSFKNICLDTVDDIVNFCIPLIKKEEYKRKYERKIKSFKNIKRVHYYRLTQLYFGLDCV